MQVQEARRRFRTQSPAHVRDDDMLLSAVRLARIGTPPATTTRADISIMTCKLVLKLKR